MRNLRKPLCFAAISLSILASGCKQSYASLSDDPQKRIQEVRACESSEILSQIIIKETNEEIFDLAYKKLMDKSMIDKELDKMSQLEISKIIDSTFIPEIVINHFSDSKLLADAFMNSKKSFIAVCCRNKISDDEVLAKTLSLKNYNQRMSELVNDRWLDKAKLLRFNTEYIEPILKFNNEETAMKLYSDDANDDLKYACISSITSVKSLFLMMEITKDSGMRSTMSSRLQHLVYGKNLAEVFDDEISSWKMETIDSDKSRAIMYCLWDRLNRGGETVKAVDVFDAWVAIVKKYIAKNGDSCSAEQFFVNYFPSRPFYSQDFMETLSRNKIQFKYLGSLTVPQ